MSDIKVGDRVRLTRTMYPRRGVVLGPGTEGTVVGFGSSYPIAANLPGVDGYLLKESEFEKIEPPVEVFKPGDVVRDKHPTNPNIYLIRGNGGFINLSRNPRYESDYEFTFTSEDYEKVDLAGD